jgi:hypothetical protein
VKVCLIEGCKRGPASRGLCGGHYPMLWALVKLGLVSQARLVESGFLLPSKHSHKFKPVSLKSRTGKTLTEVIDGSEDT